MARLEFFNMDTRSVYYSVLEDSDINKLVYLKVKPEREAHKDCSVKDYCNNPSDAWPIILENKISVVNYCGAKNDWYAVNHDFSIESMTTENPLRAAMIVYLMMEEE